MQKTLLSRIRPLLGNVDLEAGESFYWSPRHHLITYHQQGLEEEEGQWALLHEAAHAILGHNTYSSDFELLLLEVAAWDRATKIGHDLGIRIDPEHVQDCVDTYRDWLNQRSTCPVCGNTSLQPNTREYRCFNCQTSWQVSASRFCRPYRLTARKIEKSPEPVKVQTTFR